MPWKIAGFIVGLLTGTIVILSIRMPLYLNVPVMVGLTLAAGSVFAALGERRKR
ncbi:MAG: hypothetical protein KGJ84_11505 [Elusimicrobia bacterium]|nr:hypothetical protein [Elusimicrobiota bacterium]